MAGIVHPKLTTINSGGTLVNQIIYPYPCIVHGIHVAHNSGSAAWIQIFDQSSAPANGEVPRMVHTVAANSDAEIEPFRPLYFENGLYVCESSTLPTKTLQAVAHLFIFAHIELNTTP